MLNLMVLVFALEQDDDAGVKAVRCLFLEGAGLRLPEASVQTLAADRLQWFLG